MQFLGAFSTAGQVAPSSIICERKQTSLKDDIFKTWRVTINQSKWMKRNMVQRKNNPFKQKPKSC